MLSMATNSGMKDFANDSSTKDTHDFNVLFTIIAARIPMHCTDVREKQLANVARRVTPSRA